MVPRGMGRTGCIQRLPPSQNHRLGTCPQGGGPRGAGQSGHEPAGSVVGSGRREGGAVWQERKSLAGTICAQEVSSEEVVRIRGPCRIERTKPEEAEPAAIRETLSGLAQPLDARGRWCQRQHPDRAESESSEGTTGLPPREVPRELRPHPVERDGSHINFDQNCVEATPDPQHGERIGDERNAPKSTTRR